ncbi:MAG: hypothetical protein Q9223_002727 [Gallowayella weberi]
MAPIKRKPATEKIDAGRPEKKQKQSRSVPSQSSLRQEEPSFPRGGASILTPLEQKQIQIQAKNDVLFEQETGRKAPKNDFIDEEDESDALGLTEMQPTKAKRKPKPKGKLSSMKPELKEKGVRIEGLSYTRLVAGSVVLGQVSCVNRYDVALSLPNNLTGYLPITSVSHQLTANVERLAVDNEEDEDRTQDHCVDLNSYFFIGQYLRACVVSTERDSAAGTKARRHIELSINPEQVNSSLKKTDLITNSMVQASVRSVEDHGLIMELGVEGGAVRGFMSSKEIGKDVDISRIKEGAVFLCLITGLSSNGAVVKLSAEMDRAGNLKKGHFLADAPTVNCFLPGTAVELSVTEVTKSGILAKAMGVLDLTADLIHSGAAATDKGLESKYHVGDKMKGRIICTFPDIEPMKLGFSVLEHVTTFRPHPGSIQHPGDTSPTKLLPLSTIVSEARVARVEPGVGLLVDVGVKGIRGFVHISRITDGKIENLATDSGPYKAGSVHKARIIGYNYIDGLFIVSLEPKVIAQPFLSIDDVQVGQIVRGTIEKLLIKESGVSGLIINLADGITGLVPEVHFSDIHLHHPEKKFKEGAPITARILSTLPAERQLRLTLKKTLINSEVVWKSYEDLQNGDESPGTLVKLISSGGAGAVVQFYGAVRGFLPVSEMSESYIDDPKKHFSVGQVVKVRLMSVDPAEKRLIVSCKDPSIFGAEQQQQFQSLVVGSTIGGTVSEKVNNEVILELTGSNLKAILPFEHLTDGSSQKSVSAAKKIRVGQELNDLIILSKADGRRLLQLTNKPSLIKAAQSGKLLKEFDDVQEGAEVDGYVNNVTSTGVFVHLGGGVSGLLHKSQLPADAGLLPDFGMRKNQSISTRVLSVDHVHRRVSLTMKAKQSTTAKGTTAEDTSSPPEGLLSNPVDEISTKINDFSLGKLTKARIYSVKETQLNVQLADGVQGRIDVSEIFDKLEDVKDRKHPLKVFHPKQVLPVRILGMHDSKHHRFLPITHRRKTQVFELSAKPSNQTSAAMDILTLDKVSTESTYPVYINNVAEDCVWVNLSANVRGRIKALDLSDDVSLLKDLGKNFPVGSALRAKVINLDITNNRLDLSSRASTSAKPLTFSDLSVGMVLPGKVTRVNERQVMVQLNDTLSGPVNLVDLADDYAIANPAVYEKNQIIRVCIKSIDVSNKKVHFSTRPSKTLSSSLPVEDREIRDVSDLNINDIVRGFVKRVADNGLFISLAANVTAFVRVSNLSDLFLKDWKADYEIDQLVKGKVIQVDMDLNHLQMSLKKSHIDKDYKPPLTFDDMAVGQIVTGKVRKVEDFGVFIVVDNSANVSGLCHKTQMADRKAPDPKKLYDEGDQVKAKVLKIDRETRRISFGLKTSFFKSEIDADDAEDTVTERPVIEDSSNDGSEVDKLEAMLVETDNESDAWEGLNGSQDTASDTHMDDEDSGGVSIDGNPTESSTPQGLNAGEFDWTGGLSTANDEEPQSEVDEAASQPKEKKRRKAELQIDRTGDLDAHGPQSGADFERLLMGRPNSSVLWLSYMAFQLQLSEVDKAREIAERALGTIHIREQDEKLNVWVALLNLENTYGTEEGLEMVFKRACHLEIMRFGLLPPFLFFLPTSSSLIHMIIGFIKKADALLMTALSKHGSASPALWLNAATFYLTTLKSPPNARALLPRALQCLPPHTHLHLSSKFAQLEYTSPHGDPERGRTVFEGLLDTFPKRLDLWNVLLDLEIKRGESVGRERVRELFERVVKVRGLKSRKMRFWFKKWMEWEEKVGDQRGKDRVEKLAEDYARRAAEEKGKGENI